MYADNIFHVLSVHKTQNSNFDKSQIVTKLKKSKCGKNQKNQTVTILYNSKCYQTQKLKMWQNSTTQNVRKLKKSKMLKTQIVTKIKNSYCDKTWQLKLCQNFKKYFSKNNWTPQQAMRAAFCFNLPSFKCASNTSEKNKTPVWKCVESNVLHQGFLTAQETNSKW